MNPAAGLRNKAHSLKKRAAALSSLVKSRREYLQSKIDQKLAHAAASLEDMTKVVARLQEVVQTVNLYLGRDEEMECLREGATAPAGTPITIRQNVLFMDEEVALEHHNIDFEDIEKFDQWLLKSPKNLAQVIPEPKGVVVLRVRRKMKDYDAETLAEVIEAAEKNELNATSYWLIKNGEQLHRIYANIAVGERLLPRANEVEHFFFDREYDVVSRGYQDKPLRPGSSDFMAAMEKADAVRRHYMRLMLVLQGLLDRTQLFVPYPNDTRPNLLNPENYEGQVTFIRDAENVLFDGRPTFAEWLKEANGNLRDGQRIVGHYPTYFPKDVPSLITPAGASGVNDGTVYTVTEKAGEFRFAFDRTDEIYVKRTWRDSGGHRAPKTKGSYRIQRSDKFFVCIDNVEIEDMEYYLNDRRHRHEYQDMVPSLKKAVKFKKDEAKAELPFRDLLLRKLNEAVPKHVCTPELLDQLVLWYKTKNKLNRALLDDDRLAYQQIMTRYVRMKSVDPVKAEANKKAIMEAVSRMGDVLFACDLGENRYSIIRAIDGQPTISREEIWKAKGGTAVQVEVTEFMLPQKIHYRGLDVLYSSPAWALRIPAPNARKYLIPSLYPAALEFVKGKKFWDGDRFGRKRNQALLAVYVRQAVKGTEVIATSVAMTPRDHNDPAHVFTKAKAHEDIPLPDTEEINVLWTMDPNPTFKFVYRGGSSTHITHQGQIQLGWQATEYWVAGHILHLDEAFMEQIKGEIVRRVTHNRRVESINRWVRECGEAAVEFLRTKWKEKQLGIYISQGGDIEFFDDHLKTLPKQELEDDDVREVLDQKLKKGATVESITGKTLGDLGLKGTKSDVLKELISLKWTVPAPAKEIVDDDDEPAPGSVTGEGVPSDEALGGGDDLDEEG